MSTKLLGIDIFRVDTTPVHELGLIVDDVRGGQGGPITVKQFIDDPLPIIREFSPDGEYKYVKATTAVNIGDCVAIDTSDNTNEPASVRPTTGVTDAVEGIAIVAIPLNSFGWIQVRGRVPSQAAATATVGLRYGPKLAAAGAANDVKVASATAGTLATSGATAAEDSNRGRVIRQLDVGIDDGSTTQFRSECYIY